MRTLGLTVATTLLPIADEEIKIFAVLHMSLFGPFATFRDAHARSAIRGEAEKMCSL
jgi:hypothetical protein